MNKLTRAPLTLIAVAAIATGAAACSSNGTSTTPSAPPAGGGSSASSEPSSGGMPTPAVAVAKLGGISTGVELNKSFIAALTSLKVSPAPIAPATLATNTYPTPELLFPITGGNVSVFPKTVDPYVQGMITHSGGFSLTAGGKTVKLTDFLVDPGKSLLYGRVNGASPAADLFILDGSGLNITHPSSNEYDLDGTKVELTADAASALNKAFGITALKQGIVVGIAHIKAIPAS